MTVSILGCGWYGRALAKALIRQNIIVNGSVTTAGKLSPLADLRIKPYIINLSPENTIIDPGFFDCDMLVISIPPRFKSGETAGYLLKMQAAIAALIKYHVRQVIYISSTGVYGNIKGEANELTYPSPDTPSGRILLDAENIMRSQTGFKTTIIRFGGLVGPGRHPGRFFAGKQNIPNGRAPVNLIHLDDCLAITQAIIQKGVFDHLFNACSSHHPPKNDFYKFAAAQAGLPLPAFIDELKEWKIINSINLKQLLNYHFMMEDWFNLDFGDPNVA